MQNKTKEKQKQKSPHYLYNMKIKCDFGFIMLWLGFNLAGGCIIVLKADLAF